MVTRPGLGCDTVGGADGASGHDPDHAVVDVVTRTEITAEKTDSFLSRRERSGADPDDRRPTSTQTGGVQLRAGRRLLGADTAVSGPGSRVRAPTNPAVRGGRSSAARRHRSGRRNHDG